MDSARHNKKGTSSTPPKLARRTRRQSAEAKRKADEEAKRLKEEKRRKTMFAPRKHGRIGPYDLTVDRNLPKIYIGQEDAEDVKHEIKLERQDDEEDHADNMDAGFEVFQLNDEMEGDVMGIEYNLNVDKVLPLVLPMLKQKDVFRCRLVNKQWRGMVDDFIEDSVLPQQYDDEAYLKKVKRSPTQLCPLPKFRIVKYAYKFNRETRERELEHFNGVMKSHMVSGLSPFVGNAAVTLKELFVELLGAYFLTPATKIFLENFGVHIRRLIIQQSEMDVEDLLDCLKKCLHHVPNLKRLKLIVRKRKYEQSELTNLKLQIYASELLDRTPKLDKLDTLEFQYVPTPYEARCEREDDRTNHSPYLEEILNCVMIKPYYQSQLTTLQLDWANNLLNLKLCNVKELKLVNLQCKLNELEFRSPVEKLTISKPFSTVNLGEILKKFSRLRYLSIDTNVLNDCLPELNLPENDVHTLEIMEIGYKDYIPDNLDFVFPKLRHLTFNIKSLETRYVILSSLDEKYDHSFKNGRVKIAHLICGGTSYDSSIWKNLQQLEIFTFQFQDHSNSPKRYKLPYTSFSLRQYCECKLSKGTKYECPFYNLVETREGFQTYQERVSRLMEQCSSFSKDSASGQKKNSEKVNSTTIFENKQNELIEAHPVHFILPFLDRKDILKCRLVNKQLRGTVDDFIEKSIVPQDYDDNAYLKKKETSPNQPLPLPKFRNVEYAYNFHSERILEEFNQMMESDLNSQLSPFVGGATITLNKMFVNATLLEPALLRFLKKFGVHIKHLVIIQNAKKDETELDVVRFVEYVKLCLHHVPALESLKIIGSCRMKLEQSEMDKIHKAVFKNEILSHSPNLKKLTTLQLDFFYENVNYCDYRPVLQKVPYMDEIFHDIMIKPFYETQLKHLQLVGMLSKDISLKMCNLKELSLNVKSFEIKKMFSRKWLVASVEKLNLSIKSTEAELFNILHIFPAVRYLKLEDSRLSVCNLHFNCKETLLIPPSNNIHTLELVKTSIEEHIFRGFPKLRFVFVGKARSHFTGIVLDELIETFDNLNEKGELGFSDLHFLNRVDGCTTYDSGIWELLPALEVLKVQFQVHDCCKYYNSSRICKITYVKGTKFECPFRNIVETRDGYTQFYERLSRLMPQFK